MKPLSLINLLLLPCVVGAFWWSHVRHLQKRYEREISNLRVIGYNYNLVDQTTKQPIRSLPNVTIQQQPLPIHGSASWSSARITGRWVGRQPQTINVIAQGYKTETVEVGEYQDEPQKLELTPLPRE